ncbi:MAG: translation initiation factor IF-3 [Bacteroidetes bacterium]|nr:MAG: translation initiation factor IF-3 [Bacteroidota bacterium]MBL1144261.1 translation initiation factor IF-3 [Bacteroidota bacterium]NOG57057.1 translation initiation factor IF-3 [Bacteroidota bacterium]
MARLQKPRRPFKQEDLHKINNNITAREVRVVGTGVEQGVFPLSKALQLAEEQQLDLVEISPNAEPPVCKIIDYKKFLYEQKKKQKEIKAKAQKVVVKEIRYGPNTDDHDFNFKLNHAQKFIEEGAKVKAYVFFKGRSILFKDKGQILLLKLAQSLEEIATVESMPKMEGKRMIMMLAPKKKK